MLWLLIPVMSGGQLLPPTGHVFNDQTVARVDILLHPDSLNALLQQGNWYSDHEYPADFVFTRGSRSDTTRNVGFRLRGNTSRSADKKSFRVSVNTFVSGRRYELIKDFNFNGNHNDPSMSRAKFFWDLCRLEGLAAPRANHVALYINGQYRGVYLNTEHINEDFTQLRFGSKSGNLYKCLYPASLTYISGNPNDYKLESQGRRVYELQTNTDTDDYSDLAHFIRVLHQTPAAQIYCALDTIFNVEDYLHTLAVDVSTGNWDGYYNKNNFYLYHNPATGKFEYIPYDTDNSFGIDWFGINWQTINAYNWKPSGDARPLYEKLMANTEARNIFSYYLKQVSEQLLANSWGAGIDSIKNRITPWALNDTYRTLDYGFSQNDFLQSFTTTSDDRHVKIGIKPFGINRANNTLAQLPVGLNIAPVISKLEVTNLVTGRQPLIKVRVEDETAVSIVMLTYTWQGNTQSLALFDDGAHQDDAAGDGIYANTLPVLQAGGWLGVRVSAVDGQSNTRYKPCAPALFQVFETGPLVLNEFLADNNNNIEDEAGVNSDWVELYNTTSEPYFLAGHYLTDNLSNPDKWAFPADTIAPGAHYLVWASNVAARGSRHAAFALSKSGEALGLFKKVGSDYVALDTLVFGAQLEDVSMGRQSDGHSQWVSFNTPTPNAANSVVSVVEVTENFPLQAYPNPFTDGRFVVYNPSEAAAYTLYNTNGQLLRQGVLPAVSTTEILEVKGNGLFVLLIHRATKVEVLKLLGTGN